MNVWPFTRKDTKAESTADVTATDAKNEIAQEPTTHTAAELEAILGSVAAASSGASVTTTTAQKVSAVYGCVRILSGAIGSLPVQVMVNGEEQPHHPLADLVHETPNSQMTAFLFWATAIQHVLLQGNFYALIEREYSGRPVALIIFHPARVSVYRKNGRTLYRMVDEHGQQQVHDQDDVVHVPNWMGYDGLKGKSVLAFAADSVGIALSAQDVAGKMFKHGTLTSGVLEYPGELDDDQLALIRKSFVRKYSGSDNAFYPVILPEGGKFNPLSIPPADAQLLESRSFQVSDIARFFGVPLHLLAETSKNTSWGSGIEQLSILFESHTVRHWLKSFEQEGRRKIFRGPYRGAHMEFNVRALLRADVKTRNEGYKAALGGNQIPGYMTPNEVRKLEGLRPMEGGDTLYVPLTADSEAETDNAE